jgi:hypothetical protein
MAELDGLSGELAGMEEMLKDLESLEASINDVYATLDQLGQGMCKMCNGTGMCNGQKCGSCNGKGPWRPGPSLTRSMGMGGPGKGEGQSADKQATPFQHTPSKVKGEATEGEITASWLFQGDPVKGEASQSRQDVARTAEKDANDAITEERVPRQYHGPMKRYFGDVRQKAGADQPADDDEPAGDAQPAEDQGDATPQ